MFALSKMFRNFKKYLLFKNFVRNFKYRYRLWHLLTISKKYCLFFDLFFPVSFFAFLSFFLILSNFVFFFILELFVYMFVFFQKMTAFPNIVHVFKKKTGVSKNVHVGQKCYSFQKLFANSKKSLCFEFYSREFQKEFVHFQNLFMFFNFW